MSVMAKIKCDTVMECQRILLSIACLNISNFKSDVQVSQGDLKVNEYTTVFFLYLQGGQHV